MLVTMQNKKRVVFLRVPTTTWKGKHTFGEVKGSFMSRFLEVNQFSHKCPPIGKIFHFISRDPEHKV